MHMGWLLGGHSILLMVWVSAAVPVPGVLVVVGQVGDCDGVKTGSAVHLAPNMQVYVPESSLPIWDVITAEPARVLVRACSDGAKTQVCRHVAMRTTAERCAVIAPLGIVLFNGKSTVSGTVTVHVYGTLALLALVILVLAQSTTP
jgi:hypothetical protein